MLVEDLIRELQALPGNYVVKCDEREPLCVCEKSSKQLVVIVADPRDEGGVCEHAGQCMHYQEER